jgi:hydrogenase maturation protease
MLLIIGYGNTLRSDDGVGPHVAEAIAGQGLEGVETVSVPQLTPELAEPISRASTVIFVDAALDAPREVQLRNLVPADSSQILAHAATPQTMLALARDVFGRVPVAWWLTIPIENTAIGEALSRLAQHGCTLALQKIKALATQPATSYSQAGVCCKSEPGRCTRNPKS